MSKIQFDNGVMILSAVDPLSNRMSIQILQLPQPPKLEPLDFHFESVSSHRKRVRPSKETRAIVERELMIVRSNSKFTEHFAPPLPIMAGTRPISTSSYESTQTSSQGTTSSQSTRRRRPSLGLVQRLFASNEPEPEPLEEVSWLDADICDRKHHTSTKRFPIFKDLLLTTKRIRKSKSYTAPDQYASSQYRTRSWWSDSPPPLPLVK
ncbi:unnamed protein product [Umbelopsis vinacea]